MTPPIKVFVSTGNGTTLQQEAFIRAVEFQIRSLGFEPQTVGRNIWSPKQPLIPIEGALRECSGTVVIAFERIYSASAIERRNTNRKKNCGICKLLHHGIILKLEWPIF